MPKCPKCGSDIDKLKVVQHNTGILSVVDGNPIYEWASDIYGSEVCLMEFICPECDEVIFDSPEVAMGFLL